MTKILLAGEGGQGVQVIAEIIARAAFIEGKHSTYIPNFGVEQRGGVSLAFVIVDNKPVFYPKFEIADVVAILSNRSIERVQKHIGPKTEKILGPAVDGGLKSDLPNKTWNILVMGKIIKITKAIATETVVKLMDEKFKKQFDRNPQLRELDMKAIKNH